MRGDWIKEKLFQAGFDSVGITRVDELSFEKEQLKDWLQNQYNGTMDWMARNVDMRTDPRLLLEGACSVIVVLLNYYPREVQLDAGVPVFSKYAFGMDYHRIIKKKLGKLVKFIQENAPGSSSRAFVDSAPIMERSWAVRAGLGWTGKHSLLITRNAGSFFFIGIILTSLELEYDAPFNGDYCGSCTRCIEACPTGAIVSAGVVDARKCLSYLTIEHKGEVEGNLHGRVFGCDICQDVCPWNKLSIPTTVPEFSPDPRLISMNRDEWMNLGEEDYQNIFKGTPADRIGFVRLKRNITLATSK
ncbi:MAG: tRNA epoxyqueuosine(34) reductase QueG [Bacteroidales bacterium]